MHSNDSVERRQRLGQFPLCLQDLRSTVFRHDVTRMRGDDLDRLAPDRAGGAEERDSFHSDSVGTEYGPPRPRRVILRGGYA